MKKNAGLILLIFVFTIAANLNLAPAWAATAIENLHQIATLPILRIGITNAPGNGHQSAAATVVTRLRQLGYRGKIQIIYASGTKYQLGFLIPPFNPLGPDIQNFPDLNLSFVSSKLFDADKTLYGDEEFGLYAADDFNRNAASLRVRSLLTLQPYGWNISSGISSHRAEICLDSSNSYHAVLDNLDALKYIFALPKLANEVEWIETQMNSVLFDRQKKEGLKSIFANKDRIDIAAAYGHFVHQHQALVYAQAIGDAMDRAAQNGQDLFPKGVVMLIINDLDEAQLTHIAASAKSLPRLSGRVDVINIGDIGLQNKLKDLKRGQILIVKVGSVPKPIFELLYQSSAIAPLVEGKNSMNLMELIGRPYLPTLKKEGYSGAHPPALATDAFMQMINSTTSIQSDSVTDFLIEARIPDSDLSRYFFGLKPGEEDLSADKLYQGLKIMNQLMGEKIEATASQATLKPSAQAESCTDLLPPK